MSVSDKALKVVAERPAPPAIQVPTPGSVLFAADAARSQERDPRATFLADLALNRAVETPLCIGLFGGAGTGKSTLLRGTLDACGALGRAAAAAGLATPFTADIAILRVFVEPGRDPYASLLDQAHAGLAEDHPALVADAASGFGDPQSAVRDADDRLSAARHRLDEERRRLDEVSARQARLVETVLFDGAGSRVDAYARANRGRIGRALRRFGFAGDAALTYKELVRDAAEPGMGPSLGWVSAFWAYRGQLRLILIALVFFVAAWLVGLLAEHQDSLLDALRSSNEKMGPAADWLTAHASWLTPARQVLDLAGIVALATNVVRAARFIQPIARGATLLRGDLDGRRRDLDGLVAHQAQRVEAQTRDVEQASGQAAAAARRLSGAAGGRRIATLDGLGDGGITAAAQAFFAAVAVAMPADDARRSPRAAPGRLLVALDGFERVSSDAAAAWLSAAHICLGRPGIVTLVAADRDHLASGFGEADPATARAALERIVQIPVGLGSGDGPWPGARSMASALLKPASSDADPSGGQPDAGRSAFDKPWLPKERAVVEAIAPFAGATPRTLKRYVNLYRVARADPALADASGADLASLALGLALAGSGDLPPASLIANGAPLSGELQAARHAAATALGVALDLGRESRGLDVARRYGQA